MRCLCVVAAGCRRAPRTTCIKRRGLRSFSSVLVAVLHLELGRLSLGNQDGERKPEDQIRPVAAERRGAGCGRAPGRRLGLGCRSGRVPGEAARVGLSSSLPRWKTLYGLGGDPPWRGALYPAAKGGSPRRRPHPSALHARRNETRKVDFYLAGSPTSMVAAASAWASGEAPPSRESAIGGDRLVRLGNPSASSDWGNHRAVQTVKSKHAPKRRRGPREQGQDADRTDGSGRSVKRTAKSAPR